MAVMEVVNYGDPALRKKTENVVDFKNLDALIENMFDTMYEESGIGLAANQVGVDLNLFIVDISDIEEDGESVHIFINGKIIDSEGKSLFEEGCLSVPDIRLNIERPESILFKFFDKEENTHTKQISGLLARVIQHEIDHLNGMLIVDRVNKTAKIGLDKELVLMKKNAFEKSKYRKAFVL